MKTILITFSMFLISLPLYADPPGLGDTIDWLNANLENITKEESKFLKRTYAPLQSDDICIYKIKETKMQITKNRAFIEELIVELPLKELKPVYLYTATGKQLDPVFNGIRFEKIDTISGMKNVRIKYRTGSYDVNEAGAEPVNSTKFDMIYENSYKIDANIKSWEDPTGYKNLYRAFQNVITKCRNNELD